MLHRPRYRCAVSALAALICLAFLPACSGNILHTHHDQADSNIIDTPVDAVDYTIAFDGASYSADRGDAIATYGSEESTLVFIKSGVYRLTGNRVGQIQVSVADTEEVTLILDDFTAVCDHSAALYIKNAERVYIEVPEGKSATFTDASVYEYDVPGETKPNACIYASDDIVFRGSGTLTVNGNYNNGIGCKNDLTLRSGNLIVNAVNNAVKGNVSVTLSGTAHLTVTMAEDGIKADSILEGEGYVLLKDQATVTVTCADDAIQAYSAVTIEKGCRVLYNCDGNPVNCDGIADVAEGTLIPLH